MLAGLQVKSDGPLGGYLASFVSERTCPSCEGARLNARARSVRVAGKAIWQITALSVKEALGRFASLEERLTANGPDAERLVLEKTQKEIHHKLRFLDEVGLGYLTLDRRANTLFRRRGPAGAPGGATWLQPARRLLHPGRAHHRPAYPRQQPAAGHPAAAGGGGQHRAGGGA